MTPDRFIPLAEQHRAHPPADALVPGRALRQARAGSAAGTTLTVSVNLSARDAARLPAARTRSRSCLEEPGVAGDLLELEITESAMMADPSGPRGRARACATWA